MGKTKIGWTEKSWNVVTGCNKISSGCANCYSYKMTERLRLMGQEKYKEGFDKVVCHQECLNEPAKWKKPSMVFVNSMSDTFHDDVPMEFIIDILCKIRTYKQHTFQILTKRAKNLVKYDLSIPDNAWLGVTVENQQNTDRIDYLRQTDAKVKFISFEPLLSGFDELNLKGIDWCIIGCESGTNRRKIELEHIENLVMKCLLQEVPIFVKQIEIGGKVEKDVTKFPDHLRLRQYPEIYKSEG